MAFHLYTSFTSVTTPYPGSTPMAGASVRSCMNCKLVSVLVGWAGFGGKVMLAAKGSKNFSQSHGLQLLLYQPVETQELQPLKCCPYYS